MSRAANNGKQVTRQLAKSATGIRGLDEITLGGLPAGRPTLVCGGAGCGKTLLAMEFLVRGATQFQEPGVFMAFEETGEELVQNVRSLGFDLHALAAQKRIVVDHVSVQRDEIEENGEYDLSGLFIRLGYAIDSIGAKRVVLDTIENLFGGLSNQAILRAELRRLFRWLKDRNVTAVITAERGEGKLTRQGLEEYVSDCVILLDHRVFDQVSTRRLRVVKYRGSSHGTNEYPFLIDQTGFSVLPITSISLDHPVSDERISTGIRQLDEMLGGAGVYRGSSVLVSGTAGTGKTSLGAHMAEASCRRGERCLMFSLEEGTGQIARNMLSIGIDLRPWIKKDLLRIVPGRPALTGLEMHLSGMHRQVETFQPRLVIVDPISNLADAGTTSDATAMLTRLLDFLKAEGITGLFTCLTGGGSELEATAVGVSSVVDTWLLLRDIELGGERNRGLYVLKSRGMAHSNQIREFLVTNRGIQLKEVYVGPEGVLTGSMRVAQEARERARGRQAHEEMETRRRALERRRQALQAQLSVVGSELEEEEAALRRLEADAGEQRQRSAESRQAMAQSRRSPGVSESADGAAALRNGKRRPAPRKGTRSDRPGVRS